MSVKTRAKTWTSIADELGGSFSSEFVFDLPVALPEPLKGVPHSPIEAKPIIEDVCDRLRTNPQRKTSTFNVPSKLKLNSLFLNSVGIDDLGDRDTFSFEERTFIKAAINGI